MKTKIQVLTIWQPWEWFLRIGLKLYETRDWEPDYWKRGQLIALHAGKKWTAEERLVLERLKEKYPDIRDDVPDSLPKGAISCVCRLHDIIKCDATFRKTLSRKEKLLGDFSDGRYAWRLETVKVFDNPIYVPGQRGLWTFDFAPYMEEA